MAEKQYISREAAINELEEWYDMYPESDVAREALSMAKRAILHIPAADVVERASGIIGVIPTADVRPVVLCRDCQCWDTDWIPSHARDNEHFCPVVGLTTRSDWFCADGEKREES